MTIRLTTTVDTQPLDDYQAYLASQQEISAEIMQDVKDRVEAQSLDELQYEPPERSYPGDYPIEWTSDRQRKAYFATDGFGKGIPYQRTGKLANSWQLNLIRSDDGSVSLVYENPTEYAKFVGGSLAQDRQAALRFQQKFHRITGWQPYTDTAQFWVDAIIEEYQKRWKQRLGEFGTAQFRQRAYTKGTRRR